MVEKNEIRAALKHHFLNTSKPTTSFFHALQIRELRTHPQQQLSYKVLPMICILN